ncbi:hypothetical protein GCM10027062_20410 [Nocardioides hungaricus]
MIRTRSLVGLALASTVLLTGCSATGGASGWNLGVAARVGDQTISLAEVQDTASTYCSAIETQLQEGQVVANSVVASQVAGSLALRAAAEQYAALEGAEPDAAYDDQASSLEQAIAGLSDDQQEAVRAVNLAQPYAAAIQLAVGRQLVGGGDGKAAQKAAQAAGQKAFADWLAGQEVRIDPRYSAGIGDGSLARVDTQVSYPVSATAKAAAPGGSGQSDAAGLPPSQRCGG